MDGLTKVIFAGALMLVIGGLTGTLAYMFGLGSEGRVGQARFLPIPIAILCFFGPPLVLIIAQVPVPTLCIAWFGLTVLLFIVVSNASHAGVIEMLNKKSKKRSKRNEDAE